MHKQEKNDSVNASRARQRSQNKTNSDNSIGDLVYRRPENDGAALVLNDAIKLQQTLELGDLFVAARALSVTSHHHLVVAPGKVSNSTANDRAARRSWPEAVDRATATTATIPNNATRRRFFLRSFAPKCTDRESSAIVQRTREKHSHSTRYSGREATECNCSRWRTSAKWSLHRLAQCDLLLTRGFPPVALPVAGASLPPPIIKTPRQTCSDSPFFHL